MLLRGTRVGEAVSHGGAVFFAAEGGVEGVRGAIEPGAAEVIDEEIACERGDPGLEAALLEIEAREILVELEEDVLGEVFGVGGGAGEAVADGVDAPVLGDDKLLPGVGVAGEALANEFGHSFLRGFLCGCLLWRALQRCLKSPGRWYECNAWRGC